MLSSDQTERMIHSFAGMCRSVILATVVSGAMQALIYTLISFIVGANKTPMIGLTVFLASFVPLVGAAPVTFGVALYHLLVVNRVAGVILLVTAVVVSLVDNVIRPWVMKGAGNLHPLLGFIAAFGGLQMFGFLGVFLGPIIAGLFVVTVESLIEENGSS
jgi:predicted PurR-regulated permease PerM